MKGGIILAGGGSGGHLSPGLAVAERLHSIAGDIETVFACSDRKIDRIMLEQAGARFEVITAAPFSIRPRGLLRMVRLNLRGTREAERLFRNTGATTMVAMGGVRQHPGGASGSAVLRSRGALEPGCRPRASQPVGRQASR